MKSTKILVAIFILVILAVAAFETKAAVPSQAQASSLAVPDQVAKIVSIVATLQCRLIVSVLLIDEHGGVHPADIEGLSIGQMQTVLSQVPADHVHAVVAVCPRTDTNI